MEESIRKSPVVELEGMDREGFTLEGESKTIYKNMCKKIDELVHDSREKSEKQKYEDAIKDIKKWATNLMKLSTTKNEYHVHSFVYWLLPEMILDS